MKRPIRSPIHLVKGETVTKQFQILEKGIPKDITGMTFKFAASGKKPDGTDHTVAAFDAQVDGPAGTFLFEHDPTGTTMEVFSGKFEVAMYDATGDKTVLTVPGGVEITVREGIIAG